MAASPGKSIKVKGQSGHQGFALSSLHLGYLAVMKDNTTHQLHIEMPLSFGPYVSFGGLPDSSVGLGKKPIQAFTIFEPGPELVRFGKKLRIAELLKAELK